MAGIDQRGRKERLTGRVVTFTMTGGGAVMKGTEAIISSAPGFSVWSMKQYGLMSTSTLSLRRTLNVPDLSKWAVLYFTPRNLGDFKPRFKCHNSKHISKASAHTKGQSYSYQREHFLAHTHIQRYKEALVWETFVCLREGCIGVTEDSIRVQPRLWLVFQWSILNQQNQLHGRA